MIAVENPTYKQAYRSVFQPVISRYEPIEMDALWDAGGSASERSDGGYCICDAVPSVSDRDRDADEAEDCNCSRWANEAREGRYIIEDDYDSEFRYKGKPIPALQG